MNIWQSILVGIVLLGITTAVNTFLARIRARKRLLREAEPELSIEIGYGGDSGSRFYVVRLINSSNATAYDIRLYLPGITGIAFSLPELEAHQATNNQNLRFSVHEPVVKVKQEGLRAQLLYYDLYGREFALFQDLIQMPRADGFYDIGQDVTKRPTLTLPRDKIHERWKIPQRKF